MPQRAHTFQVNWCLKVRNTHLKLLSLISGFVVRQKCKHLSLQRLRLSLQNAADKEN